MTKWPKKWHSPFKESLPDSTRPEHLFLMLSVLQMLMKPSSQLFMSSRK